MALSGLRWCCILGRQLDQQFQPPSAASWHTGNSAGLSTSNSTAAPAAEAGTAETASTGLGMSAGAGLTGTVAQQLAPQLYNSMQTAVPAVSAHQQQQQQHCNKSRPNAARPCAPCYSISKT
eukprot:GHRR01029194.1.p2 GENE.GHRR01029194.1~~GHRR01029194.1.p2  ORF type:complete len:122 (+),score=61.93 GHRR01029194.1:559-924(+)